MPSGFAHFVSEQDGFEPRSSQKDLREIGVSLRDERERLRVLSVWPTRVVGENPFDRDAASGEPAVATVRRPTQGGGGLVGQAFGIGEVDVAVRGGVQVGVAQETGVRREAGTKDNPACLILRRGGRARIASAVPRQLMWSPARRHRWPWPGSAWAFSGLGRAADREHGETG